MTVFLPFNNQNTITSHLHGIKITLCNCSLSLLWHFPFKRRCVSAGLLCHKAAQFDANFQLTHIAPCLHTSAISQLVNNISTVMKPKCSSLCSQKPTNLPYVHNFKPWLSVFPFWVKATSILLYSQLVSSNLLFLGSVMHAILFLVFLLIL